MSLSCDRRKERLDAARERHALQVAALMEARRSDTSRPPVWAWSYEAQHLVRIDGEAR